VEKQLKEMLKRPEIDGIRDRNGNHSDADAEEAITKILDAVDAIAGRDLDCGVELRDRTVCCRRVPAASTTSGLEFRPSRPS
jgi:hypothetical protein